MDRRWFHVGGILAFVALALFFCPRRVFVSFLVDE